VVVATKNSRNETDGGWFRRCAFNASGIGVEVDEDQATDGERTHVGERAGILAFERNFDADLQPDLVVVKQSTVLSDPFNSTSNPKRIPGALIEYRILVTNQGDGAADPRSVVLTDPLPARTRIVASDIAAPGSGPVAFIDGATSSGLALSFGGLGSTTDDLQFSNDGASSFIYSPDPDPLGDDAVTHVRVTPSGIFRGRTDANAPSFELRFRTRVD